VILSGTWARVSCRN